MATPKSTQSSLNLLNLHQPSPPPSQVRVVLRIRPFLPSEFEPTTGNNPTPCISALRPHHRPDTEVTVHLKDQWTSRNESYKLDSFYGQEDHVDQIFYNEVRGVIPGIFRGLNATVFAYGATGSGKTYTMQGTEDELGLIPLAMSTILSSNMSTVEISYYEVYMDRCYDLLQHKAKEIMALDDKDGRVQFKGLSSVEVRSMDEFREIFLTGVQRRKVAHTGLNDVSSRSHGVLAIAVTHGSVKGKLNLIDLAGNEDNRRTGNDGIRLQESAKINQSLFALSNVIYALNNNEPHIPYRQSKLTRILQDSLGGTNQALMVACLNPISYKEAVHTVSLAARSRQIVNYGGFSNKKNTPKEKVDMEAKLRAWLESKGKTKNNQRIGNFSPFGRTPTSTSQMKNSESVRSSVKSKRVDRMVVNPTGRKLFDSVVLNTATVEESRTRKVEVLQPDNMLPDLSFSSNNENNQNDSHAFSDKDQLGPSETIIHPCSTGYSGDQDDTHPNNDSTVPDDVDFGTCRTSSDGDSQSDPIKIIPEQRSVDTEDQRTTTDAKASGFPESPSKKENLQSCVNTVRSPLISEKIEELRHSLRRVLSPISSNVEASNHVASDGRICIVLVEPKTPITPCILTCDKEEVRMTETPFDKYNVLSSNVKESLVQEYLAFLNVASKEELLQIKGIGQKRAEYILELRENTPKPLKSLSDLEKIGLSSKQVQDLFKRAARGIFS